MNQEIKRDAGKAELTLVPPEIITAIAKVRMYGTYVKGYERDSWQKVELERYYNALARHTMAFLKEPSGTDEESGLPHLWHVACNVAFLCELMKGELDEVCDQRRMHKGIDETTENAFVEEVRKVLQR